MYIRKEREEKKRDKETQTQTEKRIGRCLKIGKRGEENWVRGYQKGTGDELFIRSATIP